eukprot:m.175375 g.175375  ORF g.175375 m.175375 type:complete len:509 (-) comp10421_c0_seq2:128-1654(-)
MAAAAQPAAAAAAKPPPSKDSALQFCLDQTLGEGAYGRVRLAVNSEKRDEFVAVKIVDNSKIASKEFRKELCIIRMLSHHNIIRFISYSSSPHYLYLVMELASGGELFDRIEPDSGMEEDISHFYFRQLISAMEYIHSQGVAHRDIKPENVLLDKFGNIKITDFGLATLFRHLGNERLLDRACGTTPYSAPEVRQGLRYHGSMADLWSCGILLVAMLAGELPWDEPMLRCRAFEAWCARQHKVAPWPRLTQKSLMAFALLKKMLRAAPLERATIDVIKQDPWFKRETRFTLKMDEEGMVNEYDEFLYPFGPSPVPRTDSQVAFEERAEKHAEKRRAVADFGERTRVLRTMSQPEPQLSQSQHTCDPETSSGTVGPVGHEQLTPRKARLGAKAGKRPFIPRLTRFIVDVPCSDFWELLLPALEKMGLAGSYKVNRHFSLVVTTQDRRKTVMSFQIRLFSVPDDRAMVDVQRRKGDGIEFKRWYRDFAARFSHQIVDGDSLETCTQLFSS